MLERRKLVYAPHPEEEDEALRMLIYKGFGRVLMVDNVVNWDMESTLHQGLGVMNGLCVMGSLKV